VIKKDVTLKAGVTIKAHAYIDGHTTIDEDTTVWPSASIGTMTQDLKFRGETTYVHIGKRCQIREFVTINSSTGEGDIVSLGDDCLVMAYCHVAHNCKVGNSVIMSNGATLAGHVEVGHFAVIGGMTAIHQYARIGDYAMVGGMSRVTHDVPPFTLGAGSPYRMGGLNLVGLKRQGISRENRAVMAKVFRYTYRSSLNLETALKTIEQEFGSNTYARAWIDFCHTSKRGLIDLGKLKEVVEEDSCE
jgi:UDP-N-acetylglucosamine acyltransferase